MLLSSYQRLLRYCGGDTLLTNDSKNRSQLMRWLSAVSKQIETRVLKRGLHIEASTEYFDMNQQSLTFFPYRYPVTSVTSLYVDATGKWAGSESEVDDDSYYIGTNDSAIILNDYQPVISKRGVRIIYTGGLALHGTNSIFAVVSAADFTDGRFVHGDSSDAMGILRSHTNTSLTIEVLYGNFEVGEVVSEWETESAKGTYTANEILVSATSLSLADTYPDIVLACEIQVRYMFKNKDRFEQGSIQKDGTTSRRLSGANDIEIQPEALSYLQPYKRMPL